MKDSYKFYEGITLTPEEEKEALHEARVKKYFREREKERGTWNHDPDILHFTQEEKDKVLENYMKEHFDFKALCKVGFFKKEMKGNYKAQAERVCQRFGYKTVFEYSAKSTGPVHLSYEDGERPDGEPFAFKIKGDYEAD